ncbi:MAG: prepilin peptidase [Rickettsiales bacterium]
MFDAIADMQSAYVLCGVIWSVALGFAVGNYACSLVHRLPRGRLILDKKPYCGECGTLLSTRDLFPVFSALMLRHKCRYCGTPFPVSHTWTEILVGVLFVLAFFKYGFGEQYILASAISVFLIVIAAIHANENMIMGKMVLAVAVFGMMHRILVDHTVYNFFEGGLFALIIGVVLWHRQVKKVGHIYALPKPVELLAVGGLCVGAALLPQFLVLYAVLFVVGWLLGKMRGRAIPYTVAYGFAISLTILYPDIILL